MARPWTEVIADPNFQALSPDAKEAARNAYFQQNVLPNIPQDANASAIRLKFDQATVPTLKQAAPQQDPSLLMAPVGGAEMLLKAGTGALASIPAGLAYGGAAIAKAAGADVNPASVQSRVQQSLTYQPVSDSAKAGEQELSDLARPVVAPMAQAADRAATAVGKVSPTAETYLREAPAAAQAAASVLPFVSPAIAAAREIPGAVASGARATASGVAAAGRKIAQAGEAASDATVRAFGGQPRPGVNPGAAVTAQAILDQQATNSGQSMGAAAAAPRVSGASPELQQAIVRAAQKNGGAVNPEATQRQLDAESLGLPSYTEGQATRDPALYSEEQNLRGKHTDLAEHFNQQNAGMVSKIQEIRDQVGPDVFSTNHVEHGDTLIGAYEDIDKAANDQINAAYQKARDMVPDKNASVMSAPDLMLNVTKALHEHDLLDSAPKDIMATLTRRVENGSMTFTNIENMKTNLARIQRSFSADGNTRYAAGIIRDQLEQMPLTVDNAQVQSAYNDARSMARQRFQAMDADPAYKAVVNEKIAPDDFVRKFVINGKRDDVSTMAQAMEGNDKARQTMGVAILDHLRDAAGVGADYKGSFKQAGYNKALQALDPKLQSLVDPRTAEALQGLGNYAHNVQVEPVGATVNRSNTLSAGMADYAGGALEHAVNAKAGGLPVGTLLGKVAQNIKYGSRVKQAIQPGAGIDQLKPLTAYQQMLSAARARQGAP